ncbi:hypothetical protein A1Q2_04551 [Trichosporon asahii var. asahii CBS 8904]|uniref:Uncharacterized protein n=1 Tax=Trichosporon asahii var. asahii (strain CBS 8904) TaxID=1220162 RepID=K1VW18_TRIAC|nr:hypothetical protein A1Q2_04551 [Trichosporon asahii var. asahii CBS 8904]
MSHYSRPSQPQSVPAFAYFAHSPRAMTELKNQDPRVSSLYKIPSSAPRHLRWKKILRTSNPTTPSIDELFTELPEQTAQLARSGPNASPSSSNSKRKRLLEAEEDGLASAHRKVHIMHEMLSHSSSSSTRDDGLDPGAEALARLLTFKHDAEDKLALAAAEKNILQRRKDALQAEVRQLKSALLASQVQVAEKEKHIKALKTYLDDSPNEKIKELEDKVDTLERQNAQHVLAGRL